MRHERTYGRYTDSVDPTMVRDLSGNICFWNRAAAKNYLVSPAVAVGSVSHHLLNTVFPYPLDEINRELVEKGFWEGRLIHTLGNGLRVKVLSRWELERNPQGDPVRVVEVNRTFAEVNPESAHLIDNHPIRSLLLFLWERKRWWLWPAIAVFLLLKLTVDFTSDLPRVPLYD